MTSSDPSCINNKNIYENKLNPEKIFMQGLVIWSLAAIFYFFDNLLNVSPGAMKPELSNTFSSSAAELGILSSCYLWAYGLMQIPAGLLMDKVGPRRLLTVAAIFCAVGSFAFGYASSINLAMWGRVFIGIGASFAVVGCSKIAMYWFSPKKFAFFIGLMVTVGMLGAAFALSLVSSIVELFGWRETMYAGGIVGIVLTILLWVIVRDSSSSKLNHTDDELNSNLELPLFAGLLKVMRNSQVWIASIYAALMFVPTLAFGALWGTPFLVEAHGFSRSLAGSLVALIFIGWAVGAPLYGLVSDYIGRRNIPLYFANITTLIITIFIIFANDLSAYVIGLLMFLLGCFSSGFILAFAVVRERNHISIAGTAIGFINTLNTFGGALFQYLIGKILDLTASSNLINSSSKEIMFSLSDYQTALWTLPICLIISLVTLFFLQETYCKEH